MPLNIATYNPQQTRIHALDARVKIALVLVFSISLFCVHTWWGLGLLALIAFVGGVMARLDFVQAAQSLLPVLFIPVVTILANSFVLDVAAYHVSAVPGAVSPGIFDRLSPVALIGSFGFVPAGFARGCYYAVRIVLLVLASLLLTTTSTSTDITQALTSFLKPLNNLRVPTHDIATVASIALRFIPLTIDEFLCIRSAQTSRGAGFETGSLIARIRVWITVLIPLFTRMYRRADNLALAMDTRCYGSAEATHLCTPTLTLGQIMLLGAGAVICLAIAFFG